MRTRHTMGQDWGGRRASNPKDAPRVTAAQVMAAAERAGVEVRRGDFSRVPGSQTFFHSTGWAMWWRRKPGEGWFTMADTNYNALKALEAMVDDRAD